MDAELKARIKELKRELGATKEEVVDSVYGDGDPVGEDYNVSMHFGVASHGTMPRFKDIIEPVPDTPRRRKALEELTGIYQSLGYTKGESEHLALGGSIGLWYYRLFHYGSGENSRLQKAFLDTDAQAKGLEAMVTVQFEEARYESSCTDKKIHGYDRQLVMTEERIVEKPEVREPDLEKREDCRQELEQRFGNSEWYTVRYMAGKALSRKIPFEKWVDEIRKDLYIGDSAALTEEERKIRMDAAHDAAKLYWLVRSNQEGEKAAMMKMLLRQAYDDNIREVEALAGKALGYSSFRLFLHSRRARGSQMTSYDSQEEGHGGAGWQTRDGQKGHK